MSHHVTDPEREAPPPIDPDPLTMLDPSETDVKRALWEAMEVERIDAMTARVTNHSYAEPTEHVTEVMLAGDYASSCTCPHNEYRGADCKHMLRVAIAIRNGEIEREAF